MASPGFSKTQYSNISKASNHLAVQIYRHLTQKEKNIFFSPFGISTALALLYYGSAEETSKEILHVLGYETENLENIDIKLVFKELLERIEKGSESYTLKCANYVLCDKHFNVMQDYKNLLDENFKATIEDVNFKKSDKAIKKINKFVKEKTDGMVRKIVQTLDKSTTMVLLNGVYFRGIWKEIFDRNFTSKQSFYNNGHDSKDVKLIDMMHIKKTFPFTENNIFKAIQLPYKGNEVSMIILLPNRNRTIRDLESTLTVTFIDSLLKEMFPEEVNLALPHFKMEYCVSLKEELELLGMKKAFSSKAYFGAISDTSGICVSQIVHKAVVEVNEDGTKSAPATVEIMHTYATKVPYFIVDHPFMFVIYNSQNGVILFWGKVSEL